MQTEQPVSVRNKILVEASRLFAERGIESVSMREIASEAGLSKPGLYYYFEDKETLVLAILVENLERITALVENASRSGSDTRSRLVYLVSGFFAMTPEQRAMVRMANREFTILSKTARRAFDRIYQQKFIGKISKIISQGMQNGELRTVDPLQATWAFLGMLYPFFSMDTGEISSPAQELVSIFIDGIKASWPSQED